MMNPGGPPMGAASAPQPSQPSGPPVTIDAVVQLLRDDRMRGFRIDVETDSLVEADQDAEKQHRIEFVTAVGEYLTKLGPVVHAMPPLAPLVGGMLQFAVRGFKVGQELEELIEKTMASVSDALNQPHPPTPDPNELAKLEGTKAKTAAEVQKAQLSTQQAQLEAQTHQAKAQGEMVATQQKAKHEQDQMVLDAAIKQKQDERAHELHLMEIQHKREAHAQTLEQSRQAHVQSLEKATFDMAAGQQVHQQKQEAVKVQSDEKVKASKAKSEKPKREAEANAQNIAKPIAEVVAKLGEHMSKAQVESSKTILKAVEEMAKPKRIVRGKDGKPSHVETFDPKDIK